MFYVFSKTSHTGAESLALLCTAHAIKPRSDAGRGYGDISAQLKLWADA
jgi:hypothetical protein